MYADTVLHFIPWNLKTPQERFSLDIILQKIRKTQLKQKLDVLAEMSVYHKILVQ